MIKLIREIAGPGDLRQLHRDHPTRYPFLLQSTAPGGSLGRYDILFAFPEETLVAGDEPDFLEALDDRWQKIRVAERHSDLPFTGGWFLYLGYELAAEIEPGLAMAQDPVLPAAFAVRCPTALIYDHQAAVDYSTEEGGCINCHDPHGSYLPRMLSQPYEAPHFQLCTQCHVVPLHNYSQQHGSEWAGVSCSECHVDIHGSYTSQRYYPPTMEAQGCFVAGCHSQ